MRYLFIISLIFLLGCQDSHNQLLYRQGDEIVGFELTDDSISFVLDRNKIINFIDLEETAFFENPQTPNFNDYDKYFVRKENIDIQKVHLVGTFNKYKVDDRYLLKRDGENWRITFSKSEIIPSGGEFLFIINNKYAATPNYNQSKNFHMEPFRENELLRSYIIWSLYIIDTEYEVGYKVENDSIYFIFDPSIYSTINDNEGIKVLYDPDVIQKVQVAGSFNQWTEYFELQRKGDIFYKAFPLDQNINNWGEFKFIVNDYWVNPPFYAFNKLGHYSGIRHYNFTYHIPNRNHINGYRIEGDEIIFYVTVHPTDLYTYWERTTADQFNFKNMYLYASFLPEGNDRVLMEKVTDDTYEKRFNVKDIPNGVSHQFNFYGNGMIFLTPPYNTTNLSHTDIWDNKQWVNFEIKI
ncbi:hypothetical protein KMW28_12145 [Flammeovirga yaeyamensis]|uniref:Lipoprotein n=1 Tax=Flammeovirga yaeyamensis TaxID=367791 RepID=A0AAX1MYI8_9BACT|nr:hypothetical protein [Flammeovirga yaeyamensis]MBB3696083.1 hypothetical protein [Flammeovirga yaeyamensis]NMF34768.1 hypothetical protein [Flammeovirga yaeyamensis]QWG00404.1 hypothetical protein KMW28_12145 [Flammeovirga yaeyamensis]